MTCRNLGGGVIACGPPPGVYTRMMRHCPECNRRHRFIEHWDGAWYGTTLYGGCGDMWQDGEPWQRPFEKGWRKKAQERFRAMWQHAAPRDLYDAYIEADVRIATTQDDAEFDAACVARAAAQRAITEAAS